jgi:hypothetical protein
LSSGCDENVVAWAARVAHLKELEELRVEDTAFNPPVSVQKGAWSSFRR